jgi:hypothetical protein
VWYPVSYTEISEEHGQNLSKMGKKKIPPKHQLEATKLYVVTNPDN